MTSSDRGATRAAARRLHRELLQWLLASAYPLWAKRGYDHERGGFHERLTADGPVAADPRRARVQVRQVYCFARGPTLGWHADPVPLITQGLEYFFARYRRPDGLFRTLCAADGTPLDERALLYDQAFVLLALAESRKVLGPQPWLLAEARALMATITRRLKRAGPGFDSGLPERQPLLSNPHMHLLEAALAWRATSDEPLWGALAADIVALALEHLIEVRSGAVLERFGEDWAPSTDRLVEPGHLFEWAWLLLRSGTGGRSAAAALRLVAIGEEHGVHRGVAVNALAEDFSVHDGQARLWPQTERLKATARLAVEDGRYWVAAAESAQALLRYLTTAADGLWYDCLKVDGRFIEEPAPASSFYHIVGAIAELGSALTAEPDQVTRG